MNALTVDERDALLKEMLPVATALVCAVRDRETEDIAEALAPLEQDWLRTKALVIALAALVPDDQPFGDLAAWTFELDENLGDQLPYEDPITAAGEKLCRKCGQIRSLEYAFHRDKTRRDGRMTICKRCAKDRRQDRQERLRAVAA